MSWSIVKLGDCVDILSGFAFDSTNFSAEKGVKLIRIRDVVRGYSDTYYDGKFDKKYLIKKNDILIGMDGEFNRARWQGDDALLNQRVCKISAKEKILDRNFLYHLLPKELQKIEDVTPFVTVKHLSIKTLSGIQINLPPIGEQQRIAAILDKAEEIKHMRKLAAIKVSKLSKEIFADMFANLLAKPNTTLGSVFDVRDGTHDSPKSQTEGHPLVTSKNLNNNKINFENVSFINLEDFEAINKRSKVDYCDILMPMIGTIGNPIIVHDKNPQFAIKNVALIKTRNLDSSYYVKALLGTEYFERYVTKESKGGTQKFLSLGNIRNFPIYMPSDEHLQKFSKISNAVIQVQNSLDDSLIKLSQLISSLQSSLMVKN